MKGVQILGTTGKEDWNTPKWLVGRLASFAWDLDVCAHEPNVCARYFTKAQDGLLQDWRGLCWMNPPYGRTIGTWVDKARGSVPQATTVCLLPVRSDTKWWHRNVPHASLCVFLTPRLSFNETKQKATFPSVLVVFGKLSPEKEAVLFRLGVGMYVDKSRVNNAE